MTIVPRPGDAERAHPALAIAIGLACWGLDALAERARGWSSRAEASTPPVPGLVALVPLRLRARGLLVGLAVATPPLAWAAIRRARTTAAPAARLALVCVRPALRLGAVRAALRAGEDLRVRAWVALARVAANGEREAARCERFVQAGANEVFGDTIAAISTASQTRELIVDHSAGLAAEALGEVRRQAERADSVLESIARSMLPREVWRRLSRTRGDAARAAAGIPSRPIHAGGH